MSRAWETVKAIADKRGPLHLPAKAIVCLKEDGPQEFVYRAKLRLTGRHTARKYVRSLALSGEELQRERETKFERKIRFSILVPLYNTPEPFLKEMVESVTAQTYPEWELCLADGSDEAHGYVGEYCRRMAEKDPRIVYKTLEHNGGISENTNACLEMATGEYIALFDHDDLLRENALYEMALAVNREGADYLYSDEIVFVSPNKRKLVGMHLKPDFAPDNLYTNNYICHLSVFKKSLIEKAGAFRSEYDGSQDFDLILRLTDKAEKIVHIPRILYYWRSHPASTAGDLGSKNYAVDAGRRAVQDFLTGKGYDVTVESSPVFPTMYHVRYAIQGEPLISVITEGGGDGFTEALKTKTDWKNLEILACGEAGTKAERLNRAAAQAKGEYLLFLCGELKPENGDWIEEMLMLAQLESTGAVGGKLMFENGSIRHAGLVLGLGWHGAAGRNYYRARSEGSGYYGQLSIVEDMSAVAAECMLVRKELFEQAGGFDEQLGNALYDADLCLKLRAEGLQNVFTPYALLRGGSSGKIHLELGRGEEGYEESVALFRERWKDVLEKGDPLYNPNFTLTFPDYRVRKREYINNSEFRIQNS